MIVNVEECYSLGGSDSCWTAIGEYNLDFRYTRRDKLSNGDTIDISWDLGQQRVDIE
jgi:hypothetical protein